MNKPKLIIFDLDGTLVDSAPDLALGVNGMLKDFDLPQVEEADVRLWVGNGSKKLVERALNKVASGADLMEAHSAFMKNYKANLNGASRLYAGCEELLESIKAQGIQMALVTNKPFEFVPSLLKTLNIHDYFELLIGGDSLPENKPSPMPLLHCAEQLSVPVQDCLMVGDSKADIMSAKAAEMPVLAVLQGYNQGLDLNEFEPEVVLPELKDMTDWLQRL